MESDNDDFESWIADSINELERYGYCIVFADTNTEVRRDSLSYLELLQLKAMTQNIGSSGFVDYRYQENFGVLMFCLYDMAFFNGIYTNLANVQNIPLHGIINVALVLKNGVLQEAQSVILPLAL